MSHSRWRRASVLVLTPTVAGVIASLAGCGSSAGGSSGAGATPAAAQAGQLTAARLRSALLTRVNGVAAQTPAEGGMYSSLSEVKAGSGVSVMPADCTQAVHLGLDSAVLADAPAAAVTFKVGPDAVSEMLVAPRASAAAAALGKPLPSACARYKTEADGKTYRYTARESGISGIGRQARVLNVQTAGYPADNMWAVRYAGSGFVGAVTVVGPNASEVAVRQLGQQAYGYAAKSLP